MKGKSEIPETHLRKKMTTRKLRRRERKTWTLGRREERTGTEITEDKKNPSNIDKRYSL